MLRVLLIDDDANDRLLVQREMATGFPDATLIMAPLPAALDEALASGPYDLVITDFQLNWSDGISVFHRVRALFPQVPVVMFTGSGNEEIAVEAMKSGLDDYVVKSHRGYQRLVAVVRNVLDRVASARRIRDLETKLQDLLDRVELGVFRVVPEARETLEANPALLRLLGVSDRRDASTLLFDGILGGMIAELETGVPVTGRERELQRPDGTRVWIRVSLTRASSPIGPRALDGIVEDVTERKELELGLRRRAEELAGESKRKDRFLSVLSHELRNPLGAISNAVHLLSKSPLDPEVDRQAKEVLGRQVKHLTRLIEDLLDLTRINREALSLKKSPVELCEALQRAVDITRSHAAARNHELLITVPPGAVVCELDPVRFEQILVNLVLNAIHYTPPRGRIEITLRTSPGEVHVLVRDNGIGIPPDSIDRIFNPFEKAEFSTQNTQQWGLGIGLSLVRGLVAAHGGRVTAHSDGKDQGSEFVVTFPCPAPG